VQVGAGTRFVRAGVTDSGAPDEVSAASRRFPLRIVLNTTFAPGGQLILGKQDEPHDQFSKSTRGE
jgi:hypothetical protein